MALTKVTGHVIKSDTNITSHNINSSGIVTAVTFDGNFTGVAVTFTGDSTIGSLGITTNLNVGGISTFAGITTVTGDTLFAKQINASGITTLGDRIFAGGTSIPGYSGADDLTIGTESGNHGITIRSSTSGGGGLFFSDATSAGDNATQWAGGLEYSHGNGELRFYQGGTVRGMFQGGGHFTPWLDSTGALGTTSKRWSNVHADAATIAGNATISGNLTVDGVLTYQDVTNIDSIGIITARSDIRGGRNLNVTGISTFSDHINLPDNKQIKFGGSADFKIEHNTNENYIDSNSGHIYIRANVNDDEGDNIIIQAMSGEDSIKAIHDGAVELYHNGTKKAETFSQGLLTPNTLGICFGDGGCKVSGTAGSGSSAGIFFMTNSGGKWQISGDGHLLPDTAGAVDIGSSSKEIGDVYLADNKRLKLGSDQDLLIFHDNTHGYVANRKNNLYLEAVNYVMITSADTNGSNQQTSARFLRGGKSEIYHSDSLKFETSATGITVTGEVAASQDYPNFRPSLNFNFAGEKKLEPRVTYERTGSASFTNEFGKVVLVGDNAPRFDHDPDTKESLGLLIEPKKTNLWLYSEDLVTYVTGGEMQQSTLANTTATTDPTGGTNAVKMAATATGGAHSFYKNFTDGSNGDVHTASVWVKAAGVNYARIYVDTVGGNMGGPGVTFSTGNTWNVSATGSATQTATSVVKYPNGWWRLSVSGSFSNQNIYYIHIDIEGGEGDIGYTGNGSDGMYVWGVQFESSTQSNVTSYIPTYGAAVTRGDDIVKLDGEDFTDFYNQEEGTLVSEFKIFDRIQSSAAIANINALSSSSYADSIMFMEVGHTDGYFGRVYKNSNGINLNGSSDQSSIVQNGNQTNKVSFGWSATSVNQGLAAYLNGTLQEESADESRTPTNMTELRIGTGWQQNSAENQTWTIHAHIKKLMYYPKRLSNNQLATLTS